jgi:hypothetical protein
VRTEIPEEAAEYELEHVLVSPSGGVRSAEFDWLRAEAAEFEGVNINTESWSLWDFEAAIGINDEGFGGEFVDVGAGGEVFYVSC